MFAFPSESPASKPLGFSLTPIVLIGGTTRFTGRCWNCDRGMELFERRSRYSELTAQCHDGQTPTPTRFAPLTSEGVGRCATDPKQGSGLLDGQELRQIGHVSLGLGCLMISRKRSLCNVQCCNSAF